MKKIVVIQWRMWYYDPATQVNIHDQKGAFYFGKNAPAFASFLVKTSLASRQ